MLEEFFWSHSEREHVKRSLADITYPTSDGKVLIFRGKTASGKSTFLRALKEAYKEETGDHIVQSIPSETGKMPSPTPHKVIVHETNDVSHFIHEPHYTEFLFDKKLQQKIPDVSKLKHYLLTLME